jgi:effector-binding domain-containing protein
MEVKPNIEYREKQNYAAIRSNVKREEIPVKLPPLIPELFYWLEQKKIKPAGSPFFNYVKMMGDKLEVEVGIPTDFKVSGDKRIQPGSFPPGKYAVVKYSGPYSNLFKVNVAIEKWKDENHLKFIPPKVEFYPTDPAAEPNPDNRGTIIFNQIDES